MRIIFHIFTLAFLLALSAYFIEGVSISGIYSALISGLLVGIVNVTLRPILFLITLPLHIITLGLFSFVINALLLWWISSFVEGFTLSGFFPALLTALILSFGTMLLGSMKKE